MRVGWTGREIRTGERAVKECLLPSQCSSSSDPRRGTNTPQIKTGAFNFTSQICLYKGVGSTQQHQDYSLKHQIIMTSAVSIRVLTCHNCTVNRADIPMCRDCFSPRKKTEHGMRLCMVSSHQGLAGTGEFRGQQRSNDRDEQMQAPLRDCTMSRREC